MYSDDLVTRMAGELGGDMKKILVACVQVSKYDQQQKGFENEEGVCLIFIFNKYSEINSLENSFCFEIKTDNVINFF